MEIDMNSSTMKISMLQSFAQSAVRTEGVASVEKSIRSMLDRRLEDLEELAKEADMAHFDEAVEVVRSAFAKQYVKENELLEDLRHALGDQAEMAIRNMYLGLYAAIKREESIDNVGK